MKSENWRGEGIPLPICLAELRLRSLKTTCLKLEEVYMTRSWDAVLSQSVWVGVLETAFPTSSLVILMVEI